MSHRVVVRWNEVQKALQGRARRSGSTQEVRRIISISLPVTYFCLTAGLLCLVQILLLLTYSGCFWLEGTVSSTQNCLNDKRIYDLTSRARGTQAG